MALLTEITLRLHYHDKLVNAI